MTKKTADTQARDGDEGGCSVNSCPLALNPALHGSGTNSTFLGKLDPTQLGHCRYDSLFSAISVRAMVRLITHNILACHAKGCTSNNFPLRFKDAQIAIQEAEYNPAFLTKFMPRLDWSALVSTAKELGDDSLPEMQPAPGTEDEDFLQKLHHVLLEIHVEEGAMICPNCNHSYMIMQGIPNMLLAEHEISK
ncbi:hypothetical protein FRC12_004100 [Ceratobasidium sp. 428]|nr:hypothetical protein FRC12_004100 [Ceratobasidium sp. 428]